MPRAGFEDYMGFQMRFTESLRVCLESEWCFFQLLPFLLFLNTSTTATIATIATAAATP